MSESRETKKVLDWLNSLDGVFAYKVHGDMYQSNGISDICCCWQGQYLAIEMKTLLNPKLSPLQTHFQHLVRDKGMGAALVAHSLAELQGKLSTMKWVLHGYSIETTESGRRVRVLKWRPISLVNRPEGVAQ